MENVQREVEEILEQYVRPGLRQHGGGIRLLEVKNGAAYIKFTGHCSGCPSAKYTMESLVKEELIKHTDLIQEVKLQEEVSPELYDMAKTILRGKNK